MHGTAERQRACSGVSGHAHGLTKPEGHLQSASYAVILESSGPDPCLEPTSSGISGLGAP